MKLDAPWLRSPDVQAVVQALEQAGHEVHFVGGCVRNALLGLPITDIDIATNAHPDDTINAAKTAKLDTVPTGYDHGTITVLSGAQAFEVTTYRADTDTDGRHATVRFSGSMIEDAARRDFTMNALYARPDGTVCDPLGSGLIDLKRRHLRFIGVPSQRLQEDYLRSLRFFRFFATYGDQSLGLDADGLAAVAENLDGLAQLSKERVGAEMLKLLAAPDPCQAIAGMAHSGVLGAVLPGTDATALAPYVHLEQSLNCQIEPIARLAALGGSDPTDALRLSRAQSKMWNVLREETGSTASVAELGYRHGEQTALHCALLRASLLEMPLLETTVADAARGACAVFPVSAADVMPDLTGAALGKKLAELEARWIASDFALTRAELLA